MEVSQWKKGYREVVKRLLRGCCEDIPRLISRLEVLGWMDEWMDGRSNVRTRVEAKKRVGRALGRGRARNFLFLPSLRQPISPALTNHCERVCFGVKV